MSPDGHYLIQSHYAKTPPPSNDETGLDNGDDWSGINATWLIGIHLIGIHWARNLVAKLNELSQSLMSQSLSFESPLADNPLPKKQNIGRYSLQNLLWRHQAQSVKII